MKRMLAVVFFLALLASAFVGVFSGFAVAVSEGQTENSWETMAPIPETSHGIRAAAANGKIYVIGDLINYEYAPATNTWTQKTPMPTARTYFSIAVYQNKIYTLGGRVGWTQETGTIDSGANEVYDPSTGTWQILAPKPTNISDVNAEVINGKIYVVGGLNSQFPSLSTNEMYDIARDEWINKTTMPYPVSSYVSAVVDNRIYVIGGLGPFFNNQTQIYDPQTDSWSLGTPIPTTVFHAAAGATTGIVAPKRIYVVGGSSDGGLFSEGTGLVQVYNPMTGTWSRGSSMPTARFGLTVAVVDDQIYAIAGIASMAFSSPLKANERYTPFLPGTVPVVSVSSPENRVCAVSEVPLSFTVNEQAAWLGYSLDGQDNVTVSGNATVSSLSEGVHSLVIYAEDIAGDVGASERITFTVDASPLNIAVLSPEAKAYGASDVPLVFVVSAHVSHMKYSWDGQDNVTATGNVTLNGLSEGEHSVTIYTWDQAGNVVASEMVTFTVDTSEPFPASLAAAVIISVLVAITGAVLTFYLGKRSKRKTGELEEHY
jgi:N-acetylneuraminic acid mutarotase